MAALAIAEVEGEKGRGVLQRFHFSVYLILQECSVAFDKAPQLLRCCLFEITAKVCCRLFFFADMLGFGGLGQRQAWGGQGSSRRLDAIRFHSSLPAETLPMQSERMLGDKFRPRAPSPSAIAQSRLVSMGTCTRLPPVRESREGDVCMCVPALRGCDRIFFFFCFFF